MLDCNQIRDFNTAIFVEPQDVHELTDEDSGDEDDADKNRSSGNQLRAPAIISDVSGGDNCNPLDEVPIIAPPEPENTASSKRKKLPGVKVMNGKKKQKLQSAKNLFLNQITVLMNHFLKLNCLSYFFDDKLIDLIVDQSTQYCLSKNWPNLNVTKKEIKVFLGILIVSGCNPLGSKRDYWSTGDDLRNKIIYEAMRRDRFEVIMKCLHFKDNDTLDKNDKYSKIRPPLDYLQEKFLEHFVPSQKISHDEVMIEYFGRHDCKQAIRNKPIRFGYKAWSQNTPNGYLIAFDVYQGKTYQGEEEMEQKLGKAPATVMHLLSKYENTMDYLSLSCIYG